MPRRHNPIPSYRLHRQSGQAIVTIRGADGRRKDYLLGPYNSPESQAEYTRLIAEHQATRLTKGPRVPSVSISPTVNETLLAFIRHADQRHRDTAGRPTRELTEYRQCIRLVREHYGHTLAREFGPVALKTLRQVMIDAGLARTLVNRRVNRIRRMFKWAASEELIPVTVHQALATVTGLDRGHRGVRETAPVEPVAESDARAILPFVRPEVAAMIELQLFTGMRPGEVCRLRPCEIDRSDAIWLYRPEQHKSAWRGKPRVVPLGPQAQAVLNRFWPTDADDFVFSPRRAVEQFHATRAAHRKTPESPSHRAKKAATRANPGRPPAACYNPCGYGHAVTRGIERANASRTRSLVSEPHHGPNLPLIPHWHPNQVRHTFGTRVRKQFGLEAAQVALGHSRADVTQVYAERDLTLALKVAADIG